MDKLLTTQEKGHVERSVEKRRDGQRKRFIEKLNEVELERNSQRLIDLGVPPQLDQEP